ncbi:CAMK family protein kinase [Tritrichomonas foetus]|uniref:CAMK family protein kinase n=1 Tax=Tritrichomonas foetus TaxID=1144522 RepID=A0A1J4JP55_9EUKA|nr:CAMK family protein kinase [Tritrichomonas foetus]|eukprot:OHT00905.1 CAMK family protein kinase [Tritrichomonas foetus]
MGCGSSSSGPSAPIVQPKKSSSGEVPNLGVVQMPTGKLDNSDPLSAISSFRDWRECMSFTTFISQEKNPQIFEYRFIKSIGRGSHAEVYLVEHIESQTEMAAKIYDKFFLYRNTIGDTSQPIERVYREMQIMTMTRHPNTMQIKEVLDDDYTNSFIFVMPYADAGCLQKDIDREAIPEQKAQFIFAQIAEGLDYLHKRNICHRDIKPENIMKFSSGKYVLADFSAAIILPDESDEIDETEGTPAFYSPEECTGEPFRAKPADVWALGVTLYYMIYAHLPFFDESDDGCFLSQLFKISQQIQNDPLTLDEDVQISDSLRDLFGKIIDKDPQTRLTAREVLQHPWVVAANYSSGYVPGEEEEEEEEANEEKSNAFMA